MRQLRGKQGMWIMRTRSPKLAKANVKTNIDKVSFRDRISQQDRNHPGRELALPTGPPGVAREQTKR